MSGSTAKASRSQTVARADVLMSTAHKMAASNPIKEVIKSVDFEKSIFSKGTFPDSEEWIRGGFELAPSASEAVALS